MMRPEVVVVSCENTLQNNNECDEFNNFDEMPLLMKEETVDECGNIVFDEYKDIAFTESKIEIVENILEEPEMTTVFFETAFPKIEENERKLDEKCNGGLENDAYVDTDIVSALTEAASFCENMVQINKEKRFITLNSDQEINFSNTLRTELNGDNIDVYHFIPSSRNIERKIKANAKHKIKQSNLQYNKNESNVKLVNFERGVQSLTVGSNIEKDFILSVILDRNALCEEKIYEKMLDTKEKLFVSLWRQDLHKLQKQHNEPQSESKENGRVKRNRWNSNKASRFWCKLCPFKANDRCTLLVHIVEKHKKFAAKRKYAAVECMTPGKDPNIIWYKCLDCAFVTKHAFSHYNHLLRHNPHDLQTLSCALCPYKTKWRGDLIRHVNGHRVTYNKCDYCNCQTKSLKNLEIHIKMIHNASDVELLKCKKCSFQTKYKISLKNHLQTHSNARKMYKCPLCPFQTPHKQVLKYSHIIRHKSEEEARIHNCEFCPYKAKTRSDLKRHTLIHKSIDELKMYKCGICPYQSRHSYYLKRHRETHQAPDEDKMHPCDLCSYQGKSRWLLKQHQRIHKKPEECTMYKCIECPYQSRNSANLKRHLLQHKSIDELTLFQCDKCEYRGNSKDRLRTHYYNVHKNPEEVKWQKCNVCDFQTRQLGNLKRHMLSHNDTDEAKKFKCHSCQFRTRTKELLRDHMVKHSNVFLKCDLCDYQTKFRASLGHHRRQKHP